MPVFARPRTKARPTFLPTHAPTRALLLSGAKSRKYSDDQERDEQGRFAGPGGGRSAGGDDASGGGMSTEAAGQLASEYVRLHNEASREYSAAFRAVGARMWRDDDAHPLKETNQTFIASNIAAGVDPSAIYSIPRPLTVLDSYPGAQDHREELNREVDRIRDKYNELWQQAVAGESGKARKYSDDQERDEQGRFAGPGGGDVSGDAVFNQRFTDAYASQTAREAEELRTGTGYYAPTRMFSGAVSAAIENENLYEVDVHTVATESVGAVALVPDGRMVTNGSEEESNHPAIADEIRYSLGEAGAL